MTPAPHGWEAFYKNPHNPKHEIHRAIVGWDDDGDALVVDETTGKLLRAAEAGELTDVAMTGVTHVLPGDGWMVEYREDDTLVSYPIIAWRVSANGYIEPVSTNSEGAIEVGLHSVPNFVRIWHPDSPAPDIPHPAARGVAPCP